MVIQTVLVLTGARTGKTCTLGKQYRFKNGLATVRGDEKGVAGLIRYLSRAYKAFPEGSVELAEAQAHDRANPELKEVLDGVSHPQAGAQPRGPDQVLSDVQSSGQGSASVSPTLSGESTASDQGTAGSVSSGNGHTHSGDDGAPTEQDRIQQALSQLVHANDEHWTAEGKPRIEAVAELSGIPNVTRAMVEVVGPNVVRTQ
jgi:hypothetical protein